MPRYTGFAIYMYDYQALDNTSSPMHVLDEVQVDPILDSDRAWNKLNMDLAL